MRDLHLLSAKGSWLSKQLRYDQETSFKMRMTKLLAIFLIPPMLLTGCKKNLAPDAATPSSSTSSNALKTSTVTGTDFTVVLMPDTQNYMSGYFNGLPQMFHDQIDWIISHKTSENIVYVAGLGDEVEHGDSTIAHKEWDSVATKGYYRLEAAGIPYGVAVGNHEQYPVNAPIGTATTNNFNTYFGKSHFAGKAYYGGNKEVTTNKNNSHYDLFTAAGQDFMVIYIEYDANNDQATDLTDWAWGLCNTYASRKVIVVTHYLLKQADPVGGVPVPGLPGAFNPKLGQSIYNRLKDRPNVFMMVGGHVQDEAYREDTYYNTTLSKNTTIRSYLSDYQFRPYGGEGFLRLMKFSVTHDDVTVKTFSPYAAAGHDPHLSAANAYELDTSSNFTRPLFGAAPTAPIADGNYKILNVNSGKAVVVYNAVTTNGGNVVQWDYTSAPASNDEWTLTQIGTTGYYKIINRNSGKAMLVAANGATNGTDIKQWDYTSGPLRDDEWALFPVGTFGGLTKYKIINRCTGMCVSIQGASTANGAQVEQWDYLGQTNEEFTFTVVP